MFYEIVIYVPLASLGNGFSYLGNNSDIDWEAVKPVQWEPNQVLVVQGDIRIVPKEGKIDFIMMKIQGRPRSLIHKLTNYSHWSKLREHALLENLLYCHRAFQHIGKTSGFRAMYWAGRVG